MKDVQEKIKILNLTQCNAKMITLKAYSTLCSYYFVRAWNFA
jgi:hypothetical protein